MLLISIISLYVCVDNYSIWNDLKNANISFNEQSAPKILTVYREINQEQSLFKFRRDSAFFVYKNNKNIQRIGYYRDYIYILEDELKIPFIGCGFEKIPNYLHVDDTPSLRNAIIKLEKLPRYPLSLYDEVMLLFNILADKLLSNPS